MRLQYDIAVVGQQQLRSVLRGVERDLQAHARQTAATVRRETGHDPRRSRGPNQARGFAELARAAQAQQRHEFQAARRLEREQIAAARRVERERIRAADRVAAQERRNMDRGFRQLASAVRAQERQQRREATMRARNAARAADAVGRGAAQTVGGGVRNVVGMAGTAMAVAGGVGAFNALSSEVEIDSRVRQAIINARGPGQKGAFTPERLRSDVRNASLKTGASEGDIVGGLEVFVQRTGDLKTAVANLQVFGQVSKATGASFADVSATAADLMQKFDIQKTEDMAQAFAELAFQGKKGAFELRDMAEQFPEMAAAAQRAGLKGIGGMKTLGGLAQIARQSTGSGAEASTAVQMMLTQMVADSTRLASGEALGGRKVNIFTGKDATSPLRNAPDVIADIIAQSGGNLQQLQDVFDVRGIRAVSPMISRFREVSAAAGGGETGRAAGRQAIIDMIQEAADSGAKFSDVQNDAREALKSTASQLEILNTKLKAAIASKLFPALEKLIPRMTEMVPIVAKVTEAFADFLDFFARNPLGGIGLIIAASVAKDIASAGIGKLAARAVSALVNRVVPQSVLGGAAGGTAVGGGAAPGGGKFLGKPTLAAAGAAAGVGAGIGLSVGTAIITAGVANFEAGEAQMEASGQTLNRIRELSSPADLDEARELVAQLQKTRDKTARGGFVSTLFGRDFAESIGVESEAELRTQESMLAEARDRLSKLDALGAVAAKFEKAGLSQEAAAKRLEEAARQLGLSNAGRTGDPISKRPG